MSTAACASCMMLRRTITGHCSTEATSAMKSQRAIFERVSGSFTESMMTSLIAETRYALQQTQLVLVCNHPH